MDGGNKQWIFSDLCDAAGAALGHDSKDIAHGLEQCAAGNMPLSQEHASSFFDSMNNIIDVAQRVLQCQHEQTALAPAKAPPQTREEGVAEFLNPPYSAVLARHQEFVSRQMVSTHNAIVAHGQLTRLAPPGTLKTLDAQLFGASSGVATQTFVAAFVASILNEGDAHMSLVDDLDQWLSSSVCPHIRDDASVNLRCGDAQMYLLRKDNPGKIAPHRTGKPLLTNVLTDILTQALVHGTDDLQQELEAVLTLLPNAHTLLTHIQVYLRGNWHTVLTPREVSADARRIGPVEDMAVHALVVTAVRAVRRGFTAIMDKYPQAAASMRVPPEDVDVFTALTEIIDEGLFDNVDSMDSLAEGFEVRHVPFMAISVLHSLHLAGRAPSSLEFMMTPVPSTLLRYRAPSV